MAQVRCPQCGAITDTHAPDYPFCIGCQDNLAKCGYCRWFDREAGACLNPSVAGLFDAAPDATPPCDQHTPGDFVLVRSRSRLPLAVLGIAVALVVLVFAILSAREPPPPTRTVPAEYVHLGVDSNYHGVVGVPHDVAIMMQNPADHAVSGIRLQLSRDSLRHFTLESVDPKEDARERGDDWLTLIYPPLEAHDTKYIHLKLIPHGPGEFRVEVRLASSENEFHGRVETLIIVSRAEA